MLRARYRWQHRAGAVLCLASLLLLVSTDTATPRPERARPLVGDAVVLLGAACYACCNVAQEKLLRAPKSPFSNGLTMEKALLAFQIVAWLRLVRQGLHSSW